MTKLHCCLCLDEAPTVSLFRVNEKGADGIWACSTCRSMFPRELLPTDEGLTLVAALTPRAALSPSTNSPEK